MTIIDELLILLDDLGETSLDQLPIYFNKTSKQVLFSTMGRLVGRGWVVRKTNRYQTVYSINSHGVAQLNHTLDSIKQEKDLNWDNKWRLVIFNIPERKRRLRDALRNSLKELGFGMLKSSIWISPYDLTTQVKKIVKKINLSDQVILLDTADTDQYHSGVLVRQSWDWRFIENNYRQFINEAEKSFNQLILNNQKSRFMAKKLVFAYAHCVNSDPCLPLAISPISSTTKKAFEVYKKLRPFCLIN